MKTKSMLVAFVVLAAFTGLASAEEKITATASGPVVTVSDYQTRLKDSYISIGVPAATVEQVLPIDVDIYNARVAGDTAKVHELITRRDTILTPTYVPKVRTYFTTHPYVVNYGTGTFTVWVDDAGNEVAVDEPTEVISVDVYRQRLREQYVAIGLPENIIIELLPIDVEIYNAYATGNVTLISQLQERRINVVPTEWREKVTTYFSQHPFKVRTQKGTFTAWESKGGDNSSVSQTNAQTNMKSQAEPNPNTVGKSPSPTPREGQTMDRSREPATSEKTPISSKPAMTPDAMHKMSPSDDRSKMDKPSSSMETPKAASSEHAVSPRTEVPSAATKSMEKSEPTGEKMKSAETKTEPSSSRAGEKKE